MCSSYIVRDVPGLMFGLSRPGCSARLILSFCFMFDNKYKDRYRQHVYICRERDREGEIESDKQTDRQQDRDRVS